MRTKWIYRFDTFIAEKATKPDGSAALASGMHCLGDMKTSLPSKSLPLSLLAISLFTACGPQELAEPEAVNLMFNAATTMPPSHTALASLDSTTAYSNGPYTGTGTSCGGVVASGYQYQATELVMRHFTRKWGLRWYGIPKDLLSNAPRASVDIDNNGDGAHPPKPGDMPVWTNSTYGHVALITAVRSNALDIIEQNVSGNGTATLSYDGSRMGARWTSWVPAGWAHAEAHGGDVSW